jgi:hypothetical protein
MIKLENYPKQRERILAQQSSGTLVLLNLDQGNYYALNRVGSRAWELCDGTRSVGQMVDIISREYDAPPEVVAADLLELLGDLENEDLLSENS